MNFCRKMEDLFGESRAGLNYLVITDECYVRLNCYGRRGCYGRNRNVATVHDRISHPRKILVWAAGNTV